MTSEPDARVGGHLAYYEQHGISPVRYDVANITEHFDRRDSLYRSLGLPPVTFAGSRVLEVAPGSGQNSLYVAACRPKSFDLVEPNAVAVRDLRAAYAGLEQPHTVPTIHAMRFEQFTSESSFDVVICENWLGSLPHEIKSIQKLAAMVAPGGVLVITVVPASGFFPNIMRKLLALRITDPALSFDEKTKFLIGVFGSHLQTIKDMTRAPSDWIQDCMLNPHYFHVELSLDTVLDAIGGEMEILATFPRFTSDWRWFKSLAGAHRRFNDHALNAYRENLHNFLDYRKIWQPRSAAANAQLNDAFAAVHRLAIKWQVAAELSHANALPALKEDIGARLGEIAIGFAEIDSETAQTIEELRGVWRQPWPDTEQIRDMHAFGALFGRETVYVSFTRPGAV
jgi:SAM-dependent methyltransferase